MYVNCALIERSIKLLSAFFTLSLFTRFKSLHDVYRVVSQNVSRENRGEKSALQRICGGNSHFSQGRSCTRSYSRGAYVTRGRHAQDTRIYARYSISCREESLLDPLSYLDHVRSVRSAQLSSGIACDDTFIGIRVYARV